MVCVHTLGFAHLLKAGHLSWSSVLAALLLFWASSRGRSWRQHFSLTFAHGGATVKRAFSLLGEARKAGPVLWLAVACLAFALGFTTLLTWLMPSEAWDGVWYHDMMVGHAIQSHSYEEIPMSASYMQQANGHPRNSEMLGLWWSIFASRRLIELPSVLCIVPLATACYALCVRYLPAHRSTALLTAIAFVLLPGVRLEMRSTFMDGTLGAFSLAAVYFASNQKLRLGSSVLASTAIGLALGTKSHALLSMPLLAFLALTLVALNEGRRGWRRTLLALLAGGAILGALGGVTYIRNVLWYQNPFYPFNMTMGPYSFKGLFDLPDDSQLLQASNVIFEPPVSGADWPDIRRGSFGLITGFVIFPLAALTGGVLALGIVRHAVRSISQRHIVPELSARLVTFFVAGSVVISLATSPAVWSVRYNMYAVGFGFALVHWLAGTLKAHPLANHVAGAAFVTNCILWTWSLPGWWGTWQAPYGWTELRSMLAQPRKHDVGGPYTKVVLQTALARERELRNGGVVAFGGDSGFVSFLWNDNYDNKLVYVAPVDPAEFAAGAAAVHANWIIAAGADLVAYARAHPEDWSEVGLVHNWGNEKLFAFRRIPH